MAIFYHASVREYEVGKTYSTNQFTGNSTSDHSIRSCTEQKVNILLDEGRPEGCPSRQKCIYLFDNLEYCRFYATKIANRQKDAIKIYKVNSCKQPDDSEGFPICLVQEANKYIDNKEMFEKTRKEYCKPTCKWKVKEYLTQEIIIESILELKPLHYCDDYISDYIEFRKHFIQESNAKL